MADTLANVNPEKVLAFLLSNWLAAALVVLGALLLAGLAWLLQPLRTAWAQKRSPVYDVENNFATGAALDGPRAPFPSVLRDAPSVLVSVVVPAYNEEKRIDAMMGEMLGFLKAHELEARAAPRAAGASAFTWEVIVVDDGSRDGTAAHVQRRYVAAEGHERVRLLKLHKNNGKGGAVRKGMLRARGEYIIFADADGATKASDLATLLERCRALAGARGGDAAAAIAVGSRAHLDEGAEAKAQRTAFRAFLHEGFDLLKRLMLGGLGGVRDTQCGFKMFSRAATRAIFPVMHIERWAFDVELLFLAARFGMPVAEVPVTWHEVDGSTLDPLSASLQMLRDVFVIRLCYVLGIWKDSDSVGEAAVIATGAAPAPAAPAPAEAAPAAEPAKEAKVRRRPQA
jgi:dolichyl-phosphate beta-glucosyltransferase